MLILRKSSQIGMLHGQMDTLSCRNEQLSFLHIKNVFIVTMETNNISCMGTFFGASTWTFTCVTVVNSFYYCLSAICWHKETVIVKVLFIVVFLYF